MAEPCIPVSINHLCCRICGEVLRNPVTVPCGHNFCKQCIQKCWDKDKKNNGPCRCPECGHIFQSTPHLIKNTTLAEMVRDTENPGSEKRTKEHSGESLNVSRRPRHCTETGMSGSNLCWKHSSPLDVYCCTDDQIICAVCASAEHSGHRIGCVGEERRRKQEQLRNIQTKSKQILQKQRQKSKNLKKILTQIQEEARQTEDYCESVVVGVISSLQEHYLSVRALIGAQEEEATAWVQVSIKTLEAKMQEMKKRVSELDHLAEMDSNVHFLKEWPSLQRLCEEDHLNPFDEASADPLLPFEFTKRTVEQVGKRLEEFCDKEFASISETADRGEESLGQMEEDNMQEEREASVSQSCVFSGADRTLTQPSVEPTTRAEFLQYACELTLDPATAHVDLVVSNGDKEVMLIKAQEKIGNSAIRYPERFVHRRQVLCREGLQGERCYYEIEVFGEKAEIALTYNGIDRKSRSRLSAFGGNANSWSLDRYKNYSVSHKSDSIQLTASPTHHRIGVYLKFREGTLSFYEVSDNMNFLYRVEATFKEPLYPGFWLGEKCCIRICDLRQR